MLRSQVTRTGRPEGGRGFTLIELMVAMVVLGVLAAIIIPKVLTFMRTAREASVKSNMHTLQIAVEDFALENQTEYPASAFDILPDGRTLSQLCPSSNYPVNPFTNAVSIVQFNQRPTSGHAGELGIDPAAVDRYAIRANGQSGDSLMLVLTSAN